MFNAMTNKEGIFLSSRVIPFGTPVFRSFDLRTALKGGVSKRSSFYGEGVKNVCWF